MKQHPHIRKAYRRFRRVSTSFLSRFHISENTFMSFLAVAIGILAGLGNFAFRKAIDFFHWLIFEQGMELFAVSFDRWDLNRFAVILFPAAGGLLMIPFWIFFSRHLKFSFPDFLVRVNLRGARVPLSTIFTRGLASAITLGTGGSAGQEGPIAQIGGAIGSQFGQIFRMSSDRLKVLVACGVAGGVAATFNAPLAGVFFAQEIVLLSSFEISSFTAIVISSGISTLVSRSLLGEVAEFAVPSYTFSSPVELLFYVALGVIVGVGAVCFIRVFFKIKGVVSGIPCHPLLRPVAGGMVVGCIGVAFPQIFGNGYEFIGDVLQGHGIWWFLALLVLVKAVATAITLGSGLPGGLFAPTMFLGAMTGGTFGKLMQMLFPALEISPGAFALVGMGAFLSSATHAPMTAIFLLFEMTGSYEVIIPIMLTCVIGTAICRHFMRDSLDTVELSRQGIDLEAGKEVNIMKALKVGDVMAQNPESVPEHMTLRQFTEFIADTRHTNFPLVNQRGELAGIISVQDFMGVVFEKDLMDLVVIKELATLDVTTVHADDNLDTAMRRIGYRNIEQLPVVSVTDEKKLVGIISRRDMVSAYNKALMARTFGDEND